MFATVMAVREVMIQIESRIHEVIRHRHHMIRIQASAYTEIQMLLRTAQSIRVHGEKAVLLCVCARSVHRACETDRKELRRGHHPEEHIQRPPSPARGGGHGIDLRGEGRGDRRGGGGVKPLLCYLAHRFQAHAYKGEGMLFCRRCGEMIPLDKPEKEASE